jgi:hypothetical protein
MVHEVVNRGDIFAMRVSDQQFTVISGKLEVEHIELDCTRRIKPAAKIVAPTEAQKAKLAATREKLSQINLALEP